MFMIEYKDIGWWYWLATTSLLTIGILLDPIGFTLAIGLTLFQLIHFALREQSISAFPVQVRFSYLLLLMLALPEPLQWLFWIPCIGTWVQIIFGYCTMARIVSLYPWNRSNAFTLQLLKETFFSRPVRGSVQQYLAGTE
jgi:hypothetical protein